MRGRATLLAPDSGGRAARERPGRKERKEGRRLGGEARRREPRRRTSVEAVVRVYIEKPSCAVDRATVDLVS